MQERVQLHLDAIYHQNPLDADLDGLAEQLLELMGLEPDMASPAQHMNHWDQRDAIVITYGDSVLRAGERPHG